jgi:hypothetical protein
LKSGDSGTFFHKNPLYELHWIFCLSSSGENSPQKKSTGWFMTTTGDGWFVSAPTGVDGYE